MPIIRVTRKQIQQANKVREAALKKDDFRRHEEQRQRFEHAAKARDGAEFIQVYATHAGRGAKSDQHSIRIETKEVERSGRA